MSRYRLRRLGHQLRTGAAWIVGQSCTGARWPEGDRLWIINAWHVPVYARPSWSRYWSAGGAP